MKTRNEETRPTTIGAVHEVRRIRFKREDVAYHLEVQALPVPVVRWHGSTGTQAKGTGNGP